jgi:hypothetical protein
LAAIENTLKVVRQSMVNFSMQQNPKDFEDLCERFDKFQVDFGPNATSHESNVIFLGFS